MSILSCSWPRSPLHGSSDASPGAQNNGHALRTRTAAANICALWRSTSQRADAQLHGTRAAGGAGSAAGTTALA
jgi:hypothetical protein